VSHLTNLTLRIWRQAGPADEGHFEDHTVAEISDEASFLELLDILNERLIEEGKEAVVFDHDCREGICGSCSMMINGRPHGPESGTATCQLHMRKFEDGAHITVEPWRAASFPVIRDLAVDRSAFDRIMEAGGYVDDGTMLAIIRDRLWQPDAAKGFILDGFPRTVAQADGLTKLLAELGTPLDAVVQFLAVDAVGDGAAALDIARIVDLREK
jgi:succinate dehydrogenase / fumarate reductase iron-sulfur subunit